MQLRENAEPTPQQDWGDTAPEVLQELRRLGTVSDAELSIAEAAIYLGAVDRPNISVERYLGHLKELAVDLEDYLRRFPKPETAQDAAEALNWVMMTRHGYHGDSVTYDDLQNANLIRVIDRRKGLPVALGILYIHTAQTQGWDVCGINFPGHFLLRLDWGGERCLLDPFTGKLLNDASDLRALLKAGLGADAELEQQHYAPVGTRETLFRLQNNIKLRLMRRHQIQRALRVVETLLLVAPEQTGLLRESGFLNAHLGNLQSAVDSLQMFLNTASTDPSTRYEVAAVLQDLKTRLD